MTTFTCDKPGCQSYVTLHPTDADDPAPALERWGWHAVVGERAGAPAVVKCYCIAHAPKPEPADVSVHPPE